jgi:hypothetical protein
MVAAIFNEHYVENTYQMLAAFLRKYGTDFDPKREAVNLSDSR